MVELPDHVERMSDYRLIKTIIIQIKSLTNQKRKKKKKMMKNKKTGGGKVKETPLPCG